MTQPNPNKRQHPPTPLGAILNKYAISLSQLGLCMRDEGFRFTSKSTLHRLVCGTISHELAAEANPAAAKCLNKFLLKRGIAKSEIDAELSAIFTEGEYQPMITKRMKLDAEECRYFGFFEPDGKPIDPFSGDPRSRDEMFIPPALQAVFDRIMDAIKYQHFIAVLGGVGTGKTTLRCLVEDTLADRTDLQVVWPEFFAQRRVTETHVARTILRSCGMLKVPGRIDALGVAVKAKLTAMTRNGTRVCIGMDEGHRLNKDIMKSFKNFHEMSSGGFQKHLGIFILGWPSLEDTLMLPEFQEIYERVDIVQMPNFRDHAREYVAHRLKLVNKTIEDLFDEEAISLICLNAETPLSCGNIVNKALRIMKQEFNEPRVIGEAIRTAKTKMFFETGTVQGFRKRA